MLGCLTPMGREKAKLEEFRANNIALSNQLKRFEGIDPDAVRQLAEDKRKLEEAQQIKAGEVDKVIEAANPPQVPNWTKSMRPWWPNVMR